MRLTPFGEAARLLRMRHDRTLKQMAEHMSISSAHLSALEYGDKRLTEKHMNAALDFFSSFAPAAELKDLRAAAEKSRDVINTTALSPDARGLVAAFARRLQEGGEPTQEIMNWVQGSPSKGD